MDTAPATYTYDVTVQTSTGYEPTTLTITGPLFHGGRARLEPGELITTGRVPNSWGSTPGKSREVFFSATRDTSLSYAARLGARGRLYEVEPTGPFTVDSDPDSYKSAHPLRVVREVPRDEWPAWALRRA
jgi:Rifampin ADP-ribosyl transferase